MFQVLSKRGRSAKMASSSRPGSWIIANTAMPDTSNSASHWRDACAPGGVGCPVGLR